jgi:hypothetical protein
MLDFFTIFSILLVLHLATKPATCAESSEVVVDGYVEFVLCEIRFFCLLRQIALRKERNATLSAKLIAPSKAGSRNIR